MNILFLHNNFPAQYRELARTLAADPNNRVVYGTKHTDDSVQLAGVKKVNYMPARDPRPTIHHYVRSYENSVLHGQAVYRLALELRKAGFVPDVVCSHAGWGNGIFVKDAFPETKLLSYFEWFGHATGTDADFDPAYPLDIDDYLRIRAGNATLLVDLYSCDRGLSPTQWQQSQLPPEFQSKVTVLHDGVDTDYFFPDPEQKINFPDLNLDLTGVDEIVTYVSRGMDLYRGFPQFYEAIARLTERRPNCHVVIVAGDRVAYGTAAPEGYNSFKDVMLEKMPVDQNRVHFVGTLPYGYYKLILRASSVHVYLTRPFVLSWSFMEALASGCLVVASDTPPVRELAEDGVNALLVDFFDIEGICDRIEYALTHQTDLQSIRDNARQTIVDRYSQKDLLPKHIELIREVAGQ
jgi:glycosyltransferase involved in cell wall biosynthesis